VRDQAGGELGEQHDPLRGLGPALGDVVGVVEADAEDLAGAQHRRRVPGAGLADARLGAGRQLAQPADRGRSPGVELAHVVQATEVRRAARGRELVHRGEPVLHRDVQSRNAGVSPVQCRQFHPLVSLARRPAS
jgi:hypothetical protein